MQINLIGEEDDSYYRRQKEGTFDLIFNNTWGPPYEPHSFVGSWRVPSHADYQAQRGLANKNQLDAMIGKVLVSHNNEERQRLYRAILSTVHEQAVYLPISYTTMLMVHGQALSSVGFGATLQEIPFEAMNKR
jgi:nickel transport system substrate-binding protein